MKKRILPLLLTLVLALSLSVSAAAPRYAVTESCSPTISFHDATATCKLYVSAYSTSAKITATLTLVRVNNNTGVETEVAVWSGLSGAGSLTVTKTVADLSSGATYKLYVDATVTASNGTDYPSASVTARCP